jgi:hypothetical protein
VGQIFSSDWLIGPASFVLRASCDPHAGCARARRLCAQLRLSPQILLWDWCATLGAQHGGWVTSATRTGVRGSPGVLAVLGDATMRDEADRVAAAVGVRVVHAGGGSPVSRKTWSAC